MVRQAGFGALSRGGAWMAGKARSSMARSAGYGRRGKARCCAVKSGVAGEARLGAARYAVARHGAAGMAQRGSV